MKVFDFDHHLEFVAAKLKAMPQAGRGEYRRIAIHLGVHTTLVSQMFRGSKLLSLENAVGICEYFGLLELETEYFLLLVQIDRAGSSKLKKIYQKQASEMKARGLQIANRLPRDKVLDENDKALFYSNWYYSGIRIMTSIESLQTAEALARELRLPLKLVNHVLEFLVSRGLCIEEKNKYKVGPQRTHLEADSPHIGRHHSNWRLKAIERSPFVTASELAFSAPLSISEKDFIKVRQELAQFIDRISTIVSDTTPEKAACLNMDWFELR